MTNKERMAELAGRLRDAAKQQDPIAKAVIDLVRLTLDELKDSLVMVDGDDMLRKQGAAREMTRLYKELTVTPPSITAPGASK